MSILLVILARTLEGMFAFGVLGCVVVVILSTIEDVRTLVSSDDSA